MVILAVCRLQPLTHETVGAVARSESPVSCMYVCVCGCCERGSANDGHRRCVRVFPVLFTSGGVDIEIEIALCSLIIHF